MKNFCIITNSYKDEKNSIANKISDYIIKKGGSCVVLNNVDTATGQYRVILEEQVPGNLECVITIGGDGTLLHAAKDLEKLDVIFIGVNKGTLGFLAEISPEEMEGSIDRLLNDRFNVESRMMLCGQVIRNNEVVYKSNVLNDIVIHRGGDMAISNFDVDVNGQLLGKFQADGIILSTEIQTTALTRKKMFRAQSLLKCLYVLLMLKEAHAILPMLIRATGFTGTLRQPLRKVL